ncbi:protein kinase domain-containing protein [Streptomyces sp. NPDC055140]
MTELVGELRPGDPAVLGPWRLMGVLGEGGMGTVYLGRHGRRIAAVKTVKAELLHAPHVVARFRREREAIKAVRSPFVPRLLGADLGGPVPWLATEYVAGPTLERCVEEHGPLPVGTAWALGARLASVLTALHSTGAVHRDLKPSNVLLAADGPRLVDFGIARLSAGTRLTLTGQRPGSAGYMSPEQILGHELGPLSDVFTLGAVLVYASTGHHAFGGGPVLADYGIVHEEPDLSRVPGPMLDAVRRCLDKDPGRRAAARDLAALLREAPAEGTATGWLPADVVADIEELARRAREVTGLRAAPLSRRRMLHLAGGAVLLAAAGGVGWRWYDSTRDGNPTGEVPLWAGAPGELPTPLWDVSDLDPDMPFGPAPAGDVLLVAQAGRVTALDPRTGDRLWSHTGGRAPAPSAPWPVLLGQDGKLRGFDPRTGDVTWQGPGVLARVLAAGTDTVYAADPAGHLVAVRHGAPGRLWRSARALAPEGATATAGDGRILLTLGNGTTHAVDSASGEEKWSAPGGTSGLRPASGAGLAVLGGALLRGLALGDGTPRWQAEPTDSTGRFGSPLVHEGHVYVAEGGLVRCLRLTDGDDVRQVRGAEGAYAPARPVVAEHGLYIPLAAGAAGIAALPLAGDEERYRFAPATEGKGAWGLAAVGRVLAAQSGGRLYALPQF